MKTNSFNVKDVLCFLETKDHISILLNNKEFHCIEPLPLKPWNDIQQNWHDYAIPIPQNQNQ